MTNIIVRILLGALALYLVAELVPGIEVAGLWPAILAATVLGILNGLVRPVLVILTLPVTLLTLGLFLFVINAALFLLAAAFIDGFSVSGFWIALLGSVLVSIVTALGNKVLS